MDGTRCGGSGGPPGRGQPEQVRVLLDAVRDQPRRGGPAEVVALGLPTARYQLPPGDGFCLPEQKEQVHPPLARQP